MESERPDALFRDPYARKLAGKRGERIVASMRRGRAMAWPMIVRTAVLDELILRAIERDGVDRSEEHTSELQSRSDLVCRLLLQRRGAAGALYSFPTRRSSDLDGIRTAGCAVPRSLRPEARGQARGADRRVHATGPGNGLADDRAHRRVGRADSARHRAGRRR